MEKSLNENALNTHFDFPTLSAKYVRFHLMISHLSLGLKTTNFIHLERRSYSLLKYIRIVIVDPEITTLC